MTAAICTACGHSKSSGHHAMSREVAATYPRERCPKCSGGDDDGWAHCLVDGHLRYRCGCGVTWSEPYADG